MIYVEFIERDRPMPIEIFRALGDQASWVDPEDELVLNVGRTLRLGPHPAYLAYWRCRGMARLDEWEAHFRSDAGMADAYEMATHRAIHLIHAGCFDEVVVGPRAEGGLQYIEYLDVPRAVPDTALADHFAARAARHGHARLNHVIRRVGLIGGPLGDMAVWTVADYVALEPLAREAHDDRPFRPRQAGVYRRFGQEIL
ncbi:MAG: hypothetical protein FJX36_05275 [Alphaproteobacteria bacterium]|nr:hypothetical protein [Alphaproteobacteria bacterium]